MIKKLLYFLLFAASIAVMYFLVVIKLNIIVETESTGADILGGEGTFAMIALGITVLLPAAAMLTALFVRPRPIRNMIIFLISAAIYLFAWPILFRLGVNIDIYGTERIDYILQNFKLANENVTVGIGAVIAASICVGGVLLSLIFKMTAKKNRNAVKH